MTNLHIPPVPISAQAMADLLCTMVISCHGNDRHGNPFWAYICMKPSMAEPFKEAREKGILKLEEFGTIIEWGEGEHIPDDVRIRMHREYGADPDYENKIIQALNKKVSGQA